MFERLFKYTGEQYGNGTIAPASDGSIIVFLAAVAVLVLIVSIVYSVAKSYRDRRTRFVSLGLRLAAVVALCIPLLEPVLVTADVVPDETFVAVVVDNSASMSIADADGGATRYDRALELLESESGLIGELDDHFNIRTYEFSASAGRVDSLSTSAPEGKSTRLAPALGRVLSDFRGVPLAGVVLLTDGGDNTDDVLANVAGDYRASDVPLHVIGLGRESLDGEREILDVSVTKSVERDTGAEIDVKVRSWVDESAPVRIAIYNGSNEVFSESRLLKGGGKIDQFTLFFEPPVPGIAEYRLVLEAASDELNTQNNELEMLIDTRSDTTRVLYFEGALRSDFKFIKRALEDDQVIDFVSVSRTGTGKYYRQGIRTPDELAGGFPATEAELFEFKAIILGDIEASAFSIQQQRMIEKFVRVRGGGLLMLGGRTSFAEGDYWNTPIADVLPVHLDPTRRRVIPDDFSIADATPANQGFRFVPTSVGADNPVLKLSADRAQSLSMWATMPGLTSINLLGRPKPAAVVLAEKQQDRFGEAEPLLITQRYGRGRSTALATASTWRWQMLLDADDFRHERFWRQLVRWQVASAPDQINVDVHIDTPEPLQEVTASVDLFDGSFEPVVDQPVFARLVDPYGAETELTLREDLVERGRYTGTFVPTDEGVHRIEVTREIGGTAEASHSMLVRPTRTEFYDATLKPALLRDLAAGSGGRYYSPEEAPSIPDAIRSRRTESSVYRSEYIWDAPFWLGLAMLLLCAEWFYRRRKGLA